MQWSWHLSKFWTIKNCKFQKFLRSEMRKKYFFTEWFNMILQTYYECQMFFFEFFKHVRDHIPPQELILTTEIFIETSTRESKIREIIACCPAFFSLTVFQVSLTFSLISSQLSKPSCLRRAFHSHFSLSRA